MIKTASAPRPNKVRYDFSFTSRIRDQVFRFERSGLADFGFAGCDYRAAACVYRRPNKIRLQRSAKFSRRRSRFAF
jgi:hypothetical protein